MSSAVRTIAKKTISVTSSSATPTNTVERKWREKIDNETCERKRKNNNDIFHCYWMLKLQKGVENIEKWVKMTSCWTTTLFHDNSLWTFLFKHTLIQHIFTTFLLFCLINIAWLLYSYLYVKLFLLKNSFFLLKKGTRQIHCVLNALLFTFSAHNLCSRVVYSFLPFHNLLPLLLHFTSCCYGRPFYSILYIYFDTLLCSFKLLNILTLNSIFIE